MKKLLLSAILLFPVLTLQAQNISHIETTKNWYYIYDQDGKKIKTISTSQGELMGYSSTFYIIKQGKAFYITFDVNGKRLHTFGVASVGEIIGVAGDTFTSRQGVWIYTWSKDGKKISTRGAKSSLSANSLYPPHCYSLQKIGGICHQLHQNLVRIIIRGSCPVLHKNG